MGALKRLLRLLFLSDAPINLSYPLRMGIFYWVLSAIFLLSARQVLAGYLKSEQLLNAVIEKLFFVILAMGVLFFAICVVYAFVSSTDYKKVKQFAHEISRGNFAYNPELSPIVDRDLKEIHDSLLRLKKSLIISWELLKQRKG
ncbi:hypothetical protein [Thermovibrio ammonificans]|uniref:Uncharacterized protein n=1 Tax=Thermovibrio ammonificans (strain DSM 15698 / JCM 12110 / HB-1) TaxID=648996 RepID=E8T414_THEA1|nr:hypothetical protein [Thermovibrio ammonificans]ADU96224.1 hypothetical protein Theam_0251 [Thermovibrio ammonificans HB-1]